MVNEIFKCLECFCFYQYCYLPESSATVKILGKELIHSGSPFEVCRCFFRLYIFLYALCTLYTFQRLLFKRLDWECSSVIECLPSLHKVLRFFSSTGKKEKFTLSLNLKRNIARYFLLCWFYCSKISKFLIQQNVFMKVL